MSTYQGFEENETEAREAYTYLGDEPVARTWAERAVLVLVAVIVIAGWVLLR